MQIYHKLINSFHKIPIKITRAFLGSGVGMTGQTDSKIGMGMRTSKDSKYNPDYKRTRWATFIPDITMHYNANVCKLRGGVCLR